MLNRIIENENPTIPLLERTSYRDDASIIHGISNGVVADYTAMLNKTIKTNTDPEYPSGPVGVLHQDLMYLLARAGDRNVYIASHNPNSLFAVASPQQLGISIDEYMNEFQKLSYGIGSDEYKPWLKEYEYVRGILDQNRHFQSYLVDTAKLQYEHSYPIVGKEIFKIDPEISKALREPEANLDFLKRTLQLNPKTGYYMANGIAYLCLHEFMRLENYSVEEILNACGNSKGLCKYCGAALFSTFDDSTINFGANQYVVVYRLADCLALAVYEVPVIVLIQNAIRKSLTAIDLEQDDTYQQKVDGFTAAYCMKIYEMLKSIITNSQNEQRLLSTIKLLFHKAGWDDHTVQDILDSDYFLDIANVVAKIRGLKEEERRIDRWEPSQILNEKSAFYKAWKEGKLGEIQERLTLHAMNQPLTDWSTIEPDEKTKSEELAKATGVVSDPMKAFFIMWWKTICPVHAEHEMVKGECKYCGITEKTIDKTYSKYKKELEAILSPIQTNDVKQTTIRDNVIKEIEASPVTVPPFVNDKLLTDVYVRPMRELLEEFLQMGHIEEVKLGKETNLKILNYILKRTAISAEQVKVELIALTV